MRSSPPNRCRSRPERRSPLNRHPPGDGSTPGGAGTGSACTASGSEPSHAHPPPAHPHERWRARVGRDPRCNAAATAPLPARRWSWRTWPAPKRTGLRTGRPDVVRIPTDDESLRPRHDCVHAQSLARRQGLGKGSAHSGPRNCPFGPLSPAPDAVGQNDEPSAPMAPDQPFDADPTDSPAWLPSQSALRWCSWGVSPSAGCRSKKSGRRHRGGGGAPQRGGEPRSRSTDFAA